MRSRNRFKAKILEKKKWFFYLLSRYLDKANNLSKMTPTNKNPLKNIPSFSRVMMLKHYWLEDNMEIKIMRKETYFWMKMMRMMKKMKIIYYRI
jgi:hypothetical protein